MIPQIVAAICLVGWCMQLWFGVAVFGRPGNHELVFREKSPVMFWCIVLAELAIPIIIVWYQVQAGRNFG
jgi:hypothetical protein